MAVEVEVEVFPDSPSSSMSPRISFSHNLRNNVADHHLRSSSSSSSLPSTDFDFCVFHKSHDKELYSSSSADELFSDGKILPIEMKRGSAPPLLRSAALPPPPQNQKVTGEEKQNQKATATTSFWGFKRSASLNCGSGYARTLCPLPPLSRSNSTGSAASVKRSSSSNNKQNFQKCALPDSALKNKPPSTKGPYNGGVKINPVLNVPSTNMFALASIFSGRDKARKK